MRGEGARWDINETGFTDANMSHVDHEGLRWYCAPHMLHVGAWHQCSAQMSRDQTLEETVVEYFTEPEILNDECFHCGKSVTIHKVPQLVDPQPAIVSLNNIF